MRTLKKLKGLAASLLIGLMMTGTASAAPVLCQTVTNYHMLVDSAIVSACLDAGVGNLTGNEDNDLFLNDVGGAYDFISKDEVLFTTSNNQTEAWGTFTFDGSLWDIYSDIAVAFKFGTGQNPDEWFVYSLKSMLASGVYDWDLIKTDKQGGGLSHVNFYGIPGGGQVPEPGTLALLGMALVVASCFRRQRGQAV